MTLIKKIKSTDDLEVCKAILPPHTMDDVENHIYYFYVTGDGKLTCLQAKKDIADIGRFGKLLGRTKYEGCYWVSNNLLAGVCRCSADISIVWRRQSSFSVNFEVGMKLMPSQCSDRIFAELFNRNDEVCLSDLQCVFNSRIDALQSAVNARLDGLADKDGLPSCQDCVTDVLQSELSVIFPEFVCSFHGAPVLEEILSPAEKQQFEDEIKRAADERELQLIRERVENELAREDLAQSKKEAVHAYYLRELEREMEKRKRNTELAIAHETAELEIQKAKEQFLLDVRKIEAEHNSIRIQEELAQAKTAHECLKLEHEAKLAEEKLQEALAETRKNQKDCQAQEELIQFKTELEKAKILSEKAKVDSERKYYELRILSLEKMFASPETLSVVDIVGLPVEKLGQERYLPSFVLSKIKDQSKRSPIGLRKDAIRESCSRSPVMGKRPKAIKIGDTLSFIIECNRAGYLTVLCFGTGGDISVLVPNCFDKIGRFTPGRHSIPSSDDSLFPQSKLDEHGIEFYEMGPAGQERFIAVVTSEPLIDRALLPSPDEPDFLTLNSEGYRQFIDKHYALPEDAWSAGYVQFYVEER